MIQVKKYRLFSLMMAAMLSVLVSSCDRASDPASIIGNEPQPTWTVPEQYDLSSSMTVIAKIDMTGLYTAEQLQAVNYRVSDGDVLAAFCGNTCLGIGEWKADYEAFWLYIVAPENGDEVTLRYYSSVLRHLYAAEPIPYRINTRMGEPSEPYAPVWALTK